VVGGFSSIIPSIHARLWVNVWWWLWWCPACCFGRAQAVL